MQDNTIKKLNIKGPLIKLGGLFFGSTAVAAQVVLIRVGKFIFFSCYYSQT